MAQRETMNVSLSPEHKELVKSLVESGRYRNDSEVVRDALRLLDDQNRRRRLEELLLEGRASGPSIELTPHTIEQLRVEMAERARAARRARGKSA